MKRHIGFAAAAAAALLGGCATFSPDGGFTAVQTAARDRGLEGELRWVKNGEDAESVRAATQKLLAAPLTPESAVRIALLNNRGLQATYAELGLAEADLVQAGRLVNPGFAFERLRRGEDISVDRTFLFNLLALFTMPARVDIERRRLELTQGGIAAEVLRIASETRRAWHTAVAAQESVRYMQQVRDAAEASATLARRMAAAGNFNKLDEAREQAFHAEVTAQLARVRQTALAGRERLVRLLGLPDQAASVRLPDRLPALPAATRKLADVEAAAMKQRLDVLGAMKEAEAIAASLGLTRATGFVNVLEAGYRRNTETGAPRQSGYEIELRLPVFDWGDARFARAEHAYRQALNRAADTAVRARSEVRVAHASLQSSYEVARRYRDEIVPLRKRISEEVLLRYNGMLASVFELLADARQQVAAVNGYIEALRDYWIADASLDFALTAGSPPGAAVAGGMGMPAASAAGTH